MMKQTARAPESGIVMGTNNYLVGRLLMGLLVVSIVMMLGATVSMSIDNLVASNMLGAEALAAMNVVMPLFVSITMLSSIFANGGSALAARYIGQNDGKKVNAVFSLVMLADLVFAIVVIALVTPNMNAIASAIGAKDERIREMTVQYMMGLMIGVVPIMFNSSLQSFIRVAGNPRLGATSVLIMAAVDIVLDVLFVGPLKMGMFGLALATSLSYLAACLVSLNYLRKGECSLRLAKPWPALRDTGSVLNMGFPSALTSLTAVVRGVALNVIVAIQLGTLTLSAMSAQGTVGNFVSCASLGVGFAIMPLIGIFFGEQDRVSLIKTMKRSLTIGTAINIAFAVIISVLAAPIARVFNIGDPETVAMVQRSIWFFAASMVFAMINYAFVCYYQNAKRVWLANVIIIGKVALILVCTIPFIGALKDNAIWLGGLLSEALACVLFVIAAIVINKKFPTSLEELLLLPKEWDTGAPCYEVSLKNNLDDCIGLSQKIQAFCEEHGMPRKTAYYSALCLEEMAVNTIVNGFKDQSDHFIDIKVMLSGDTAKLRFRDDGAEFNPIDYVQPPSEDQADDPIDFSNIGIKLVKQLAQSMDYRYTMRLNNLFIEVADVKKLSTTATLDNWQTVESFLRTAMKGYQVPVKVIGRMMLAAEELYVNIAKHAYAPDTGDVRINVKPLAQGVSITFFDRGKPFDPTAYEGADASLGIQIARKSMDIFNYTRDADNNATTIGKYW